MTKNIFIWVAHPKSDSFCAALATAYQTGVERTGATVRRMDLSTMRFATQFSGYGPNAPALEDDLLQWQENVRWADHIMIVHPYWWGAMPALAKTVLDRALTPGFAYKYHDKGVMWDKLLAGRTADIVITSDTPPWIDTLLYWRSGRRVLKNQVLGFCGIKTKHAVQIGSVKMSSAEKRQKWLKRLNGLGAKAGSKASQVRRSTRPDQPVHCDPLVQS